MLNNKCPHCESQRGYWISQIHNNDEAVHVEVVCLNEPCQQPYFLFYRFAGVIKS
jgi:hypothetical protein